MASLIARALPFHVLSRDRCQSVFTTGVGIHSVAAVRGGLRNVTRVSISNVRQGPGSGANGQAATTSDPDIAFKTSRRVTLVLM